MNPLRYAILHHQDRAGEHWDFLIEQPAALATWKFPGDPTAPGALPAEGRRIADHRKVYLDYEGPVRGDRGHVRRVDGGACDILDAGENGWRVVLRGGRLRGFFTLRPCGAGGYRWRLDADVEPNSQGGQTG
jgi:hypothetical protein